MTEELTNFVQLITAITTCFIMFGLLVITYRYTDATKKMSDMMAKQFVYDHKPYLSIRYCQKESSAMPVLEFKNHSEKRRINVRYNIHLIPPAKASNIIEMQKPENLLNSEMIQSYSLKIEPGESQKMVIEASICSGLDKIGMDWKKDKCQYGIAVNCNYTTDIPDIGSFSILKYWHVANYYEQNICMIMPLDLNIH